MSNARIPIPSTAEVCVLDDVQKVTSIPHHAQEALSSEHTPTLSYSLPFYHAVIDEWKHLKCGLPLLSPYIEIGIAKVEEYIKKSRLSRTYSLAVCKPPISSKVTWILML